MKRIFHLASCSTNQRILKEWGKGIKEFTLQDIKTEAITEEQLDEMKRISGSYESLFSKVALKYRAMGLHEKKLTEKDFKKYILQEYTFLKRPVMVNEKQIFIGNAASVVTAAKASIK
ncbi:MAG: arsenate reductase family protein [Flavobacteriales bacterium]